MTSRSFSFSFEVAEGESEESYQERQPPDVISPEEGNRPGVH